MTLPKYPNPSSTVSGNTTTYTITDTIGNTLTIAATHKPNKTVSCVFSGTLINDGLKILDTLIQQLYTGTLP